MSESYIRTIILQKKPGLIAKVLGKLGINEVITYFEGFKTEVGSIIEEGKLTVGIVNDSVHGNGFWIKLEQELAKIYGLGKETISTSCNIYPDKNSSFMDHIIESIKLLPKSLANVIIILLRVILVGVVWNIIFLGLGQIIAFVASLISFVPTIKNE